MKKDDRISSMKDTADPSAHLRHIQMGRLVARESRSSRPAWMCTLLMSGLFTAGGAQTLEAMTEGDDQVQIYAYKQSSGVPLDVVFFAHPRNPRSRITSYRWDFGDKTKSRLALMNKTYNRPGTYEVTLTATIKRDPRAGGQTTSSRARMTIVAGKTKWKVSEYQLQLGKNWRRNNGTPLCRGKKVDCGPAKVTIRNAPIGVFELQIKMLHQAKKGTTESSPRFLFNGQLKDLSPKTKPKRSWSYASLGFVSVTNGQLDFVIDDLPNSAVSFSEVRLRRVEEQPQRPVRIRTADVAGEAPLQMTFAIDSPKKLKKVFWDFDDGGHSNRWRPTHTFSLVGRRLVKLAYTNGDDTSGVATVMINVRPSKVNLPGLKDMKHFGFWSNGLKSVDAKGFNERRLGRLRDMHVTHFWPTMSPSRVGKDLVSGVDFSSKDLWFRNRKAPRKDWIFDPSRGLAKLKATDRNNDGVSDLDGREGIEWVYVGHEMGEYSNRAQRVRIRNLVKQYFPKTRVFPYQAGVNVAFERGRTHNQLGPDEGDIVCSGVKFPFRADTLGRRVLDSKDVVDAVVRTKKYVVEHAPKVEFWALRTLPGEKLGRRPQDKAKAVKEMWSAVEILDYARTVLLIGDVDAMIFRAYGRWTYDLSFGDNDANPRKAETGFIEQRLAVKTVGSWIAQSRNHRPILIIRSPEIGTSLDGKRVTVQHDIIHAGGDSGFPVFTLDNRRPRLDTDGNKTHLFTNVQPGKHRLKAHLEKNGVKVQGTDVEVLFRTR